MSCAVQPGASFPAEFRPAAMIVSGSSTAKGASPMRVARAPHGVAEAERRLLTGEGGRAGGQHVGVQALQRVRLAALL